MQSGSQQHDFEVNYSKLKDLPINHCISFPAFYVQDFEWAIHYYPNCDSKGNQLFSLVLLSKVKGVCAEISFSLLNENGATVFTLQSSFHTFNGNSARYGAIVSRNKIEAFMGTDDIFIIACKIRVLSGTRKIANISSCRLQGYLGILLNKSETSDAAFEVEGEIIHAHKLILASKSPVFEAQFFGPMAEEADTKCIRIEDMKADVFKAMLSFMYTDQIASNGSENLGLFSTEWVLDLFVAADRYGIEKLKDTCEAILYESLSVETISTTLVLADRHCCPFLKEMCLQFASENLEQLAFNDTYLQTMHTYPALLHELRAKSNSSSGVRTKKQRIV